MDDGMLTLVLGSSGSPMTPLFGMLAMVLVMAVGVSLVMAKCRQSLLVGYLLCGVFLANSGMMEWVGVGKDEEVISMLSELGVILLMFTLGLEFSLGELRHLWRVALIGGGLQVGATALVAATAAMWFGMRGPGVVVLAVAVALSSTAVAMKSFQEIGQPHHPGARVALGVGLFQDLLVILFILLLPVLYGRGEGSPAWQVVEAIGKGLLFLAGAILAGRYGLTPVFHAVARTRSRELFTLTAIGSCAAVALAADRLELSLALGAFAAGLVLSESIYSHRVLSDILPFKDLFLTIFFVSVGVMIDVGELHRSWKWILLGVLSLLLVKGAIVFGVSRWLRVPWRPAMLAAASLASTGEFSLVLLKKVGEFEAMSLEVEQWLLACTAITMGLVPSLMKGSGMLGRWVGVMGWASEPVRSPSDLAPTKAAKQIRDHAVICGYGPVGRGLNEALKRCGIPTLVMELNADTVRELRAQGQPVLFADAAHAEAMDLAGIERARMVAFTFPHLPVTLAALPMVREKHPEILIFARAKFLSEVYALREHGVEAIHDERESCGALIRAAMGVYGRAQLSEMDVEEIMNGLDDGAVKSS